MSKKIKEILAQCLSEIKAGKTDLEGCLEQYPEQREELEPLLRLALDLAQMPKVEPSAQFRLQGRSQLFMAMAGSGLKPKGRRPFLWPRRALVPALAIILALLLGGGGMVYAAQDSLPGDALYPVKTSVEQIRLGLIFNAVNKAEFHLTLSQRRLEEVVALAQSGRPVNPAALEAIAKEVEAALVQLQGVSSQDSQRLLGRLSSLTQEQKTRLVAASQGLPAAGQQALNRAGLISERGNFIANAASANPPLLSTNPSVNQALVKVKIEGPIESLDPLIVAGQKIVTNEKTKIKGVLQVGAWVKVEGVLGEAGTILAQEIEVKEVSKSQVELEGAITNLNPLTIAGFTILTDETTLIKGELRLGLRAEVKGVLGEGGKVLARRIEIERLERIEVEFKGQITSLNPLIISGKTVVKDANTEVEGQLVLNGFAEVEGFLQPDGTILAKGIDVEGEGDDEEEQGEVEFKGLITSLNPLIIGGKTVVKDANTEVKGQLVLNGFAEVEGFLQPDGTTLAKEIEVEGAEDEEEEEDED